MKPISQATDAEKIKAIAELDGYTDIKGNLGWYGPYEIGDLPVLITLPNYLTSYDAILPVVQKQNWPTLCEVAIQSRIIDQKRFNDAVPSMNNLEGWCAMMWLATPTQLADALLVAAGKYSL